MSSTLLAHSRSTIGEWRSMVSARGQNVTPVIPPPHSWLVSPVRARTSIQSVSQKAALGFDDHFKRLRTGRFSERVVGFQNAVKPEMMSNQKRGIDLPRLDRLEQHGRAESVYQSAGNGYVV